MSDLLELSADLPEIELGPGDLLVEEGADNRSLWFVASGSLVVTRSGVEINRIDRPGSIVGEVSVLLGVPIGASVSASTPCRLRYAEDGATFLSSNPDAMRLVAVGLAERLNYITAYLSDIKHQYGDAPGLAMVSNVLARLSQVQGVSARPGSVRDPDPEY